MMLLWIEFKVFLVEFLRNRFIVLHFVQSLGQQQQPKYFTMIARHYSLISSSDRLFKMHSLIFMPMVIASLHPSITTKLSFISFTLLTCDFTHDKITCLDTFIETYIIVA